MFRGKPNQKDESGLADELEHGLSSNRGQSARAWTSNGSRQVSGSGRGVTALRAAPYLANRLRNKRGSDVGPLRQAGIPIVGDLDAGGVDENRDRRLQILELVEAQGWSWSVTGAGHERRRWHRSE